jgi:LDH2 family malate/lactate/ureidoglycolate dehydrogenase
MQPVWREPIAALCHLDAGDGIGHLAGEMAAKKAIELARKNGIGAVTVANSNYFGAAGYYAWLIAESKMVGLVASNSFPKVAAHRGRRAVLGTNPMAFAAPIAGAQPLLVDMATAAVAGSEVRRRAAAGLPLEPGMAVDAEGRPLLDPKQFDKGVALPFGGAKGFGLMLMVETLAGALTGGAIGSEVKSIYNDWKSPNRSGHFLLAIDPGRLLPNGAFEQRMHILRQMVEASGPGVRLPGSSRWQCYERARADGIAPEQLPIDQLVRLGEQYHVSTAFLPA